MKTIIIPSCCVYNIIVYWTFTDNIFAIDITCLSSFVSCHKLCFSSSTNAVVNELTSRKDKLKFGYMQCIKLYYSCILNRCYLQFDIFFKSSYINLCWAISARLWFALCSFLPYAGWWYSTSLFPSMKYMWIVNRRLLKYYIRLKCNSSCMHRTHSLKLITSQARLIKEMQLLW